MSTNGQVADGSTNGQVLHWPGRVLSAADLRHRLNGHRAVLLGPHTVVTPLAGEELRQGGVEVTRANPAAQPTAGLTWGYGQEGPHPLVRSAVQTLAREGVALCELPAAESGLACRWAKAVAECVARGECAGGVVFCADPGLVCCVANKVAGLRAVPVGSVDQAARATLGLSANLLAVEMPGRTFFEIRQILRILCDPSAPGCPDGVARTLRELDGHAHR
jgi:hypothetical protein